MTWPGLAAGTPLLYTETRKCIFVCRREVSGSRGLLSGKLRRQLLMTSTRRSTAVFYASFFFGVRDFQYHNGCVRLIWISWILWISPSSAHSIIVDFDMDFLDLGNHEILVIHIVERFLGFLGLAISGLCTRVTSHAW